MVSKKELEKRMNDIIENADVAEDAQKFIIDRLEHADKDHDIEDWIKSIDPYVWDVALSDPETSHPFIENSFPRNFFIEEVYELLEDWIQPGNSIVEDAEFEYGHESYEDLFNRE